MPADHSCEILIDAVETALNLISTASGYYTTVESVQRWDREANSSLERPYILITKQTEYKVPRAGGHTRYKSVTLGIEIKGVIGPTTNPDAAPSTDRQVSNLADDIEMAIGQVDWGTLDAEWGPQRYTSFHIEDVAEPEDGVAIDIEIQYDHLEDDTRTVIQLTE